MTDFADRPVAFQFAVSFAGAGPSVSDAAFQEVSGLESGIDTEAVVEGGENRFVHLLPKPARPSPLRLKRGLTPAASGLVAWCKASIENDLAEPIMPKDVIVSLLDGEGEAVASWSVGRAYPVKWSVGTFDAMKNELALETIELAYATLKRKL
ncbi:phage tail protein [Rhodovulum steppense]|uniref:Phage tail-like protein n=1 Tax=Rhodovulum steppense TaxID=540251 RepID=A0A4R1YY48_9RHOB|nr:phage tail protein [Rhodovulum steppense]TCM86128.1 phage tail-like protein [Rhodovulum steppense]